MLKNPTDTYSESLKSIAKRIVNSPLAQFVGYGGLDSRDFQRLRAIADGSDNNDFAWCYLDVEFRRADTNANLCIKCDAVYHKEGDMRRYVQVDQDGNEWTEYTLSCSVNYPSHGSADPATVMARAQLLQEVALFAATIQADFGRRNLLHMTRTAQQVAEDKAKADREAVERQVRGVVLANRNGMRVGGERNLPASLITGVIPEGRHEIGVGHHDGSIRKYVVFATAAHGANLQRVA